MFIFKAKEYQSEISDSQKSTKTTPKNVSQKGLQSLPDVLQHPVLFQIFSDGTNIISRRLPASCWRSCTDSPRSLWRSSTVTMTGTSISPSRRRGRGCGPTGTSSRWTQSDRISIHFSVFWCSDHQQPRLQEPAVLRRPEPDDPPHVSGRAAGEGKVVK